MSEGRRTRSGRAVAQPATSPRSPRKSRRSAADVEVISESAEEVESTPILEEAEVTDTEIQPESSEMDLLTVPLVDNPDDEKSSSFPFGNEPQSGEQEELNTTANNSSDNVFIANLAAEENANSLPSRGDADESSIQNTLSNDLLETNNNSDRIESLNLLESKTEDNTSTSEDTKAIAEDLANGQDSKDSKLDPDAEMVSEDELPVPEKAKVNDAEEVSDDELPAIKRAELPADTEVVSEDELPNNGKNKRKIEEGYDPSSPTEEVTDIKKLKTTEKEEKTEVPQEPPKTKLPDLDKYWKVVNDDPTDFAGWTYLLQYVDQQSDVDAAREAYDAFLAHYPYCYGYWRKYSDYEKYKGNKKKCEEVFERGLKAIPLSMDLWIHYLAYVKANHGEDEEFLRSQFERALAACGLEFRSDKLWDAYIKWETEGKRLKNVVKIYDRLLATPTEGYANHFDHFSAIVNNNPPDQIVEEVELNSIKSATEEDDDKKDDDKETKDKEKEKSKDDDEFGKIRKKILSTRKKIYKKTMAAVSARWTFEEAIKRPYFHVKPLERCQLKNWKDYLDFEIEQGDRKRTLVLFERCLIACALYDEFWLKLIRYLDTQTEPEMIPIKRDAYERACTVHHPDKPSLHLMWSAFEECQQNGNKAAEILTNLDKTLPNLLQIAYRRINLERRRGDLDKCEQLYEHYIGSMKGKAVASSLAIKYARFVHKVRDDLNRGLNILKEALTKDPNNVRIALQMIDLAIQRQDIDEEEVVKMMDEFMAQENLEPDQVVLFAQRKVEFLEDFGKSAQGLQNAQRTLQTALTKANEHKKKQSPELKKSKEVSAVSTATTTSNTYTSAAYSYSGANPAAAYYYGNGAENSAGYGSYADSNYNSYSQWNQYTTAQSGYSGYSQYSGHGSYY